MIEIFDDLSEIEKEDIEKNWGTTLEKLKELATNHDAQVRIENTPEE